MTEIVAELSGNHGGSLNNALRLIIEAKAAGADAVKFQCFHPARLAARRAKNPQVLALAKDFHGEESLLNLYRKTYTPRQWFPDMIARAYRDSIPWFSSVFDPDDVAFLETLDCPRYKISAFEMLDGDLINAVVATGKPIVMSMRPRQGVTLLIANNYDGNPEYFGLSDHSPDHTSERCNELCPMVERHIRLPDVDTPDRDFSLTPDQFREYVATIRG